MKTYSYFGLAIAVLLAACGDNTTTSSNRPSDTAAAAPTVALGEAGQTTGLEVSITKVEQTKQVGMAGMGPQAEAGETFVVVSYTIKNINGEPLPLLQRPTYSLIDGTGASYAPDDSATMMAAGMMDDPSGMASDLNPNVSARTKAAWKVDASSFDPANWKVVVASDPPLTFALK
jgi:hypothetical protein